MKIETKYDLGQKVFFVQEYSQQLIISCSACKGEKTITVEGEKFKCPKCYGRGETAMFEPTRYHVRGPFTIGKIEANVYQTLPERSNNNTYMMHETGIGAGSYYYEDTLFPDYESASKQCDKLNSGS